MSDKEVYKWVISVIGGNGNQESIDEFIARITFMTCRIERLEADLAEARAANLKAMLEFDNLYMARKPLTKANIAKAKRGVRT